MEQDDARTSEIEITPLDPLTPRQARRSTIERWLRSRPGRLALSAITLLLVLGALVGMLAQSNPDPIDAARIALGYTAPTPTPIIPPGGDAFGRVNAVPWGVLRIDGRATTIVSLVPLGQGFNLARGVHHLVYQARYFTTLQCVISVPQSFSDTCPLANSAGTAGDTFQRILDFQDTPAKMRSDQYKLLMGGVKAFLSGYSASTAIHPGERYINQLGQIETAQTAMSFTMGLKLVQQQSAPNCPWLCPTMADGTIDTNAWFLDAQVDPTWTITDATGRSFSPPLTPDLAATDAVTVAVVLDGTAWKVSSQDQSALDSITPGVAMEAMTAKYGNIQNGAGWGAGSGANAADGAVVIIQTSASGSRAILLWRFGLFYTANTEAARLFPTLPLASKQEQALAQTMAGEIHS